MVGEVAAARALEEEALAIAAKLGTRLILGWQKGFLAACVLAAGDHAAAAALAEEGVQAASETGDRMPLALAKRVLADAVERADGASHDRAHALMREAVQVLEEIGAQPELARTYVHYAQLLRGIGDGDAARRHLDRALMMFQEMRMVWDEARVRKLLTS